METFITCAWPTRIELTVGQGAKPGTGGLLLGSKVCAGVTEGTEDGGDIEINRFVMAPDVGHGQDHVRGRRRPRRLTPTPLVRAHRWRRPARQLRHRPQTAWPSPLTMSPVG